MFLGNNPPFTNKSQQEVTITCFGIQNPNISGTKGRDNFFSITRLPHVCILIQCISVFFLFSQPMSLLKNFRGSEFIPSVSHMLSFTLDLFSLQGFKGVHKQVLHISSTKAYFLICIQRSNHQPLALPSSVVISQLQKQYFPYYLALHFQAIQKENTKGTKPLSVTH